MNKIVEGLGWYLVFLFSLVMHEAAHAFTAWRLGDPTARGQVTLNPYPHIKREPLGMVLVPLVSYSAGGWMVGWASAPYDPEWARANPRKATLMSFAGPAANLLLVLIAAAVIRIGVGAGFFDPPRTLYFGHIVESLRPGILEPAAFLVSVVFSLNLLFPRFQDLTIKMLYPGVIYR